MNKKLEEIHKLLPDNINGEITESNVRECFTKTFAYADEVKGISDAPKDNKQYARKNGAWEEIPTSGGAEVRKPIIDIRAFTLVGDATCRLMFSAKNFTEIQDFDTNNAFIGHILELPLTENIKSELRKLNFSNFTFPVTLHLQGTKEQVTVSFPYYLFSKTRQSGYLDIVFKTGKNPATDFNSTTETGVLNLSKDIDEISFSKQTGYLPQNTQVPLGTPILTSDNTTPDGRLIPNTAIHQTTDWEFDLAVEDGNMAISSSSPWCIVAEKELEGGTFEVVGYGVITDNWTGGETNRNSRAVVRTITTSDMLFGSRKGLRFRVQQLKSMEGSQQQVKVIVNKVRRISYSVN